MLGVPAARQIVSKMNASEREKEEMVDKLERSCNKFDHSKIGALTINEYWNICRVQNRINVSKDEVTAYVFIAPQSHLNLKTTGTLLGKCHHVLPSAGRGWENKDRGFHQ